MRAQKERSLQSIIVGGMTKEKSLSERIGELSDSDLQGFFRDLAETHPNWFPTIRQLEVTGEIHYFARIKGNILQLSDAAHWVAGFRPASSLHHALAAIRQSVPLTFNQEYAVEVLWHESLHLQATGIEKGGLLVETLTQFIARHTYPKLLKAMGSDAVQATAILEKGYGYADWVTNFRALLAHARIPETKAVAEVRPILLNSTDATLVSRIAAWLEPQTGQRAGLWKKALRLMRKPPEIFLKQLARQLDY